MISIKDLRDSIMQEELLKNIEEQTKAELAQFKSANKGNGKKPLPAGPVDLYQDMVNERKGFSKKNYPKGSPAIVMAVVKNIIGDQGGLRRAYQLAKSDSDYYRQKGEARNAEIVRRQYMEEKFLPAIEATVNYSSPDEVLNCKEALNELDKLSLGIGNGQRGYTSAYIRQSYGKLLGKVEQAASDATVRDAVRKIRYLSNTDKIRTAVGLAQRILGQINKGEHLSSDEDYELISRVANA